MGYGHSTLNIVCWIPTDFGFPWLFCTIPRMNSILDIKVEMVGKDLKERVERKKKKSKNKWY